MRSLKIFQGGPALNQWPWGVGRRAWLSLQLILLFCLTSSSPITSALLLPQIWQFWFFFFCAALSSEPFKFLAETDRLHWLPNKHLLNVFHLPATGLGVRLREVEGARWRGYLGRGMKTWVRCYPPWKVHIVGQGSSTIIVWLYPLGSFKLPSAWVSPLGILT